MTITITLQRKSLLEPWPVLYGHLRVAFDKEHIITIAHALLEFQVMGWKHTNNGLRTEFALKEVPGGI